MVSRTHCSKGHDLAITGKVEKNGYVRCSECAQQRYRVYYTLNRAKLNQKCRDYHSKNREQLLEYNRQWRLAHPELMAERRRRSWVKNRERIKTFRRQDRDSQLNGYYKRKYNISWSDYKILLQSQNGKCAICRGINKPKRRLAVDHDHASGQIRGLLCHSCNVTIGHIEDSPARIQQIIDYLKRHEQLELVKAG